jgi:hypothetical protein
VAKPLAIGIRIPRPRLRAFAEKIGVPHFSRGAPLLAVFARSGKPIHPTFLALACGLLPKNRGAPLLAVFARSGNQSTPHSSPAMANDAEAKWKCFACLPTRGRAQ